MDPTTFMEEVALMGVRVTGILAILGLVGNALLRRDPAGGSGK